MKRGVAWSVDGLAEVIERADQALWLGRLNDLEHAVGQLHQYVERVADEERAALQAGIAVYAGRVSAGRGQNHESLRQFEIALDLFRLIDDDHGVLSALIGIGVAALDVPDYDQALQAYGQALEVAKAIDDQPSIARIRGNMAIAHKRMGQLERALSLHLENIGYRESVGDHHGLGMTHLNVGALYRAAGEIHLALEHAMKAIDAFEQTNDQFGLMSACGNAGIALRQLGELRRSEELARRALHIAEDIGNIPAQATALQNIGIAMKMMGDVHAGVEELERGLALARTIDDPIGLSSCLLNVLEAALSMNDHQRANEILGELEQTPFIDPEQRVSFEVSRAVIKPDEARPRLLSVLELAIEHRHREAQTKIHRQLRKLALDVDDVAAYQTHTEAYLDLEDAIRSEHQVQRAKMLDVRQRMREEQIMLEKQKTLLYNMLPKTIADRMIRGDSPIVDAYDDVSVLFLDLVNFTGLASKLSPPSLITILNDIFLRCDDVIARHGLTKIKTIGDAYLAVGNAPDPLRGHHGAIALAALEIVNVMKPFEEHGISFRIGLHCGPVIGGVVGSSRTAWDVWGDAVNVASRMESTGEAGRVHVSEQFATLLISPPSPLDDQSTSPPSPLDDQSTSPPSPLDDQSTSPPSPLDHQSTSPPCPLSSLRGGTFLTPLELERGGAEGAGVRYQVIGGAEGAGVRYQVIGGAEGAGVRYRVIGGAEGAGVRYQENGGAEGAGVRYQITLRGETEVKGKGRMTTFWLESR